MCRVRAVALIGSVLCAMGVAHAQSMPMPGDFGAYPMTRDASGTSWQPEQSPMEAIHGAWGDWMTMLHGSLVLADTHQPGPRGSNSTFSESMLMLAGRRDLGGGALTLRGMVSAEPTNGAAGYPLLFQTGETADGREPLVDRQHPHNLFMELAAAYSHTLVGVASWFVYAAPVGEPALGPPAFLHRRASELDPEAPLSHHHLDATHLSFGVLTGGVVAGPWKVEASAFNGREPDQHRSEIQWRHLDSWSARVSWNPTPRLALQVSTGHLMTPEALHPQESVQRTTASVLQEQPLGAGTLSSTWAFGRNAPSAGPSTDAWLWDSAFRWGGRQAVFGRLEQVGEAELVGIGDAAPTPIIRKASIGYQVDVARMGNMNIALGGLVSRHWAPERLTPLYGTALDSWTVFLRARLAP
jgi:hypothetical protein